MGRKKKESDNPIIYDRDFGELQFIDSKEYLRKRNSRYVGTGGKLGERYDIVCVNNKYYYTYI